MDRLSTPIRAKNNGCLTLEMLEKGLESLQESYERSEKKRREYFGALRPLLNKLETSDWEGMLAVVRLVSSGFYMPLHPEEAKYCLEIARNRGIKEFD
jgi:hypothetical protein